MGQAKEDQCHIWGIWLDLFFLILWEAATDILVDSIQASVHLGIEE
jgi:hypothetical protein